MKRFAVIGLGNFGAAVARSLSHEHCRVTAVDIDKARVQALVDDVDLALVGDSTVHAFLEKLQVQDFECIVVSTGKDSHASILIALHLKELGAKKVIVKANSADHAKVLLKVGADEAVIPEQRMAERVAMSLARPNMLDHLPLSEEYYVAEVLAPRDFVGKRLMDVDLRNQYHIQVVAVKNQSTDALDFAPGGAFKIKHGDILVVLGRGEDIEKLKE